MNPTQISKAELNEIIGASTPLYAATNPVEQIANVALLVASIFLKVIRKDLHGE